MWFTTTKEYRHGYWHRHLVQLRQGLRLHLHQGHGSADVFAHFSAIAGTGRRDLEENQRVEFETEQGPKGMQAVNIRGI